MQECAECTHLLQMFECFQNVQSKDFGLAEHWDQQRHMDVWTFLQRYLEDRISPIPAAVFVSHLTACEQCYHHLQDALREAFSNHEEVAPAEPQVVSGRLQWLRQVVGFHESVEESTDASAPKSTNGARPPRLRWAEWWRQQSVPARVALAAAAVVILTLSLLQTRSLYLTSKATKYAASALEDLRSVHRVTGDLPWRPSGGFRPSVFSGVRGPGSPEDSLLQSAARKLFQAQQLARDQAEVQHNLGLLYLVRGQPDSAAAHLEAARRRSPGDVKILNDLGLVKLTLGDTTSAQDIWKEALGLEPAYGETLFNLALLYQQKGDTAGARTAWREYLNTAATSDSLSNLTPWVKFARWQLRRLGE